MASNYIIDTLPEISPKKRALLFTSEDKIRLMKSIKIGEEGGFLLHTIVMLGLGNIESIQRNGI